MKIIGIETSGRVGSIAFCENDEVVVEQCLEKGLSHGKELIISIKVCFDELRLGPNDIDLIAVSVGPGSYTGLRVGIACAKTLAYALSKPIIAVPTLDVLAENAPVNSQLVCPILDAKRACVYACIYKRRKGAKEKITEYLVITPEALLALLPRPVIIFGDGIRPYRKTFEQEGILFGNEELGIAKARVVAMLGKRFYEEGKRSDIATITPLYLRKPAPIEKLESKSHADKF